MSRYGDQTGFNCVTSVKKVFFAFFAGLAAQMYGRELRANLAHHLLVVARDHREISHEQLVNYIIAWIHK